MSVSVQPTNGVLTAYHVKCGNLYVDLDMKNGTYFLNDRHAVPFTTKSGAQSYIDDHKGDGNNYSVIQRSYDLKKINGDVKVKTYVNYEGEGPDDNYLKELAIKNEQNRDTIGSFKPDNSPSFPSSKNDKTSDKVFNEVD